LIVFTYYIYSVLFPVFILIEFTEGFRFELLQGAKSNVAAQKNDNDCLKQKY